MEQGRLARAAGATVCLAGIAAEAVAPAATGPLTAADFAAGASLALVGDPLAVVAAAAWFVATSAAGWTLPTYLASTVALAYRAPLLALLGREGGLNRRWQVLAAIAVLIGPRPAGVATAAAAIACGVVAGVRGRYACAVAAAGLACAWLPGALGLHSSSQLTIATDLAVVVSAGVIAAALSERRPAHRVRAISVDLGPVARVGPVSDHLRRLLDDPDLVVGFRLPSGSWADEAGLPIESPAGPRTTEVALEGGGAVALVSGRSLDPTVAHAAAVTAGVAWESARVDADVRRQADAVRASRLRLLTVADEERRMLESRLRVGPLQRLDAVRQWLSELPDHGSVQLVRDELERVEADLLRLARGLYPAVVESRDVDEIAADAVSGAQVPVEVTIEVEVDLPESLCALLHFVISEGITNVSRYANASRAEVRVAGRDGRLLVEVVDDGVGGAEDAARRGLRGLADRAESVGGELQLRSPVGGPTVLSVNVPLPGDLAAR